MKKEIIIAILIIAVFVAGIYTGADLQRQGISQRAKELPEDQKYYTSQQIDYLIFNE